MHRILIVDDEVQVCGSLRRLLRRDDFEVETAASGPEALLKLEAFRPEAVLTDFRMPQMSGIELLAEVRQRLPLALRILLSGYSDLASVMASVNEGEVCHFIGKPWDNETLVPTLRALLEQREPLALLQQSLSRAPQPPEVELFQHASTLELRVRPRESFPATHGIDIIRKLAGVLAEEDLAVVSGLLERQGGRISLTAEIGGPHRFSIEVPHSPAPPAPTKERP